MSAVDLSMYLPREKDLMPKFTELPHPNEWWMSQLAAWGGLAGCLFVAGLVVFLILTHN